MTIATPAVAHRPRLRLSIVLAVLAAAAVSLSLGTATAHANTFLGCPSQIAWTAPNNNVYIYMPKEYTEEEHPKFENLIGEHVDAGTNPSAGGGWSSGSCITFRWNFAWASGGNVWTSQSGVGPHSESLGMAGSTSPSVSDTGYTETDFAFQANTTSLWVDHLNQSQGMRAGTSPSRVLPSGWVAFQANTGNLIIWNYKLGAGVNTGLGMAAETSPAIAEIAGGSYEVAFRANTGILWTYCSCSGAHATTLGMENGTSPDITANGEGWVVALQGAGSHHLWLYLNNGASMDLGGGISPSTSPSIAERQGATGIWEVAYHATRNDWLETYSPLTGLVTTEKVMRAGSSPSIAP
jgi:hypothetical protein